MTIRSPEEVVRSREFMRVLDAPPIEHGWWLRVTGVAKSGRPWHESLFDLHLEDFVELVAQDQGFDDGEPPKTPLPDIPGDIEGTDDSLPAISQDEGLALLSRFLHAERGELAVGAEVEVLHWLVLCGAYAPRRERYTVLREFVNVGYLSEAASGSKYLESRLRWPLVVSPSGRDAIERLLYVRRYVPDLYALSRRAGLLLRHVPIIRSLANVGARYLLPTSS